MEDTVDSLSGRAEEWIIAALITMSLLLFSTPFILEMRISTDSGFVTADLIAWLWAYSLAGYETGFFSVPSLQRLQHASLFFFPHFIFLVAMFALLLQWISKKTALYAAILSLLPSTIVLIVNLALSILMSGSPSIMAPVPLPFATLIGLVVLKVSEESAEDESWLSGDNQLQSEDGTKE